MITESMDARSHLACVRLVVMGRRKYQLLTNLRRPKFERLLYEVLFAVQSSPCSLLLHVLLHANINTTAGLLVDARWTFYCCGGTASLCCRCSTTYKICGSLMIH